MFGEWIIAGVGIGIKLVFAALTALAATGAVLGVIGVFVGLAGGEADDDESGDDE